MKKPVELLVVDTSAFIRNAQLQEVAGKMVTCQAVVDEVTSQSQLRRLVVLPYDLEIRTVFAENIKFVTDFSIKTGDYTSLSATDIQVIALTYQLEKEKVGTKHIRTEPLPKPAPQTLKANFGNFANIPGFYVPGREKKRKRCETQDSWEESETLELHEDAEENVDNNPTEANEANQELAEKFANLDYAEESEDSEMDDILAPVKDDSGQVDEKTHQKMDSHLLDEKHSGEEAQDADEDGWTKHTNSKRGKRKMRTAKNVDKEAKNSHKGGCNTPSNFKEANSNMDSQLLNETHSDEESDDSDDESWISPWNVQEANRKMDANLLDHETHSTVACMTTDFAMQNVLKQMKLNVVALDGRIIKELRTFIFRCTTCFKTTSIMTKLFCPHCGYKTLRKVAVSVGADGQMQIFINFKKRLTARGKKFSLPRIKGGKHPHNPILVEDQPMADNKLSKKARTKMNPLAEDYIAGFSPFAIRDTKSRSALVHSQAFSGHKHWMQKNPNEARRRRK